MQTGGCSVELLQPTQEYERSYRDYIAELGDEERYPFPLDFDHTDFPALLRRLQALAEGKDLPAGYVPSSTFWLVETGELVGVSNLRHCLNQQLRHYGGHIGLGIRPSCRKRGLGKTLLGLTIEEAWRRGICEVHVHCYKGNDASAKMIQRSGGELHSEIAEVEPVKVVQRYILTATPDQLLNATETATAHPSYGADGDAAKGNS